MQDTVVALTTWPDETGARTFADLILQQGLAACINIFPPMTSVYTWNKAVETSVEYQMVIKTRSACVEKLETLLSDQHPYDVPEWLILPVDSGSAAYLRWINENTHA